MKLVLRYIVKKRRQKIIIFFQTHYGRTLKDARRQKLKLTSNDCNVRHEHEGGAF